MLQLKFEISLFQTMHAVHAIPVIEIMPVLKHILVDFFQAS